MIPPRTTPILDQLVNLAMQIAGRRLHYWTWRIFFEWRFAWIGVFWHYYSSGLDVYICLLPCVPINIFMQYHD
jgi:hypothetical protein